MKQIGIFALGLALLSIGFSACDGGKLKQAQAENQQLVDSLNNEKAAQDSVLSLLNEVTSGMAQIKEMEKIINSTNFDKETPSQKEAIRNDMVLLAQTLQQRRQRIDELEKKLKNSGSYSAKMEKTVNSLKAQISSQAEEISGLQESLKKANVQIEELNTQVQTLSTTVDSVTIKKNEAESEATRIANELNTCYYVIGSNKELKESNIIEKKFLGRTKVLEGDFELSYFTKADKRTLTVIPLHSKKAKVRTNQPEDSYQLVDENGALSLKILNPTRFWELSNFLVVEVD